MLALICEAFVTGCCCVCTLAAFAFVVWQVYEAVQVCVSYGWENVRFSVAGAAIVIAALVFFLFGTWYLVIS